jgi:L-ribulose-5-phosphate 4-epimerase
MLDELKRESYEENLKLPEYGLIHLSFGNVSVVDRDKGICAIKPSGVPYDVLKAEDMVLVDLEGEVVEGDLRPSSDTPTHVRLYQGFPTIGGVVHTHSTHATSFAQAGVEIPCYGTTHADYLNGNVPLTRKMTEEEITGAYELETGNVILERFASVDPDDFPMVLVHSHGPFTWGKTGAKAVENAVALELVAEMAVNTQALNPAIEAIGRTLHDKHFKRKHGQTAYYGQG